MGRDTFIIDLNKSDFSIANVTNMKEDCEKRINFHTMVHSDKSNKYNSRAKNLSSDFLKQTLEEFNILDNILNSILKFIEKEKIDLNNGLKEIVKQNVIDGRSEPSTDSDSFNLFTSSSKDGTEKLVKALHDAAKHANIEFLQQSLANKSDKAENIPFHWAYYSGDMDCVKFLLPLSLSIINQKNNVGDTPLQVASWKNHPDIVQLLLENGDDKRIRNQYNKTPFDLAHHPNVRSLLEDKIIFSNYKTHTTQSTEHGGNVEDDDSD